jgi:hypothetical protein
VRIEKGKRGRRRRSPQISGNVEPATCNRQARIDAVAPLLQRHDGSFVGFALVGDRQAPFFTLTPYMVAFDATGNALWSVANEQPLVTTEDNGVIGTSGITYDQNGNATGQGAVKADIKFDQNGVLTGKSIVSPGWLGNVLGTAYSADSGVLADTVAPKTAYASTFAAFTYGNASGNGTAINQSLSGVPSTFAEQLPDLSTPACNIHGRPKPVCGNINAIELLTNVSPDSIFQNIIQTFAPVLQGAVPKNTIQTFTTALGNTIINVTQPNQELRITLSGAAGFAQEPFYVLSERVDSINHVISAVTLAGHPLAGWRYWRVYSIGTNDIVIETGAYDSPGPGKLNYLGYYLFIGTVKQAWREYMQYIQVNLHAPRGTNLRTSLGGITLQDLSPINNPLLGYWDYSGAFTNYILNNVCQPTPCH